jgi:predicted amidohydrolase YtcJ
VTARNWMSFNFRAEEMPSLAVLDEIVPNNPLWLACGAHRGHTNSLGLKRMGLRQDTPHPVGGTLCRDPKTGQLTGRLEETAQTFVWNLLPTPVDEATSLKIACKYYNSIGVTSVQNDGVSSEELVAYQMLKHSGELTMRAGLTFRIFPTFSDEKVIAIIQAMAGAALGGVGDDRVKMGGIKTGNETLYPAPGRAQWLRDRLRDLCIEMAKHKVRFLPHVEAGMCPENLSIFQEVNAKYPLKDLRWGLTHQRWTNPDMIRINRDLGLCVNQDVAFGILTLRQLEMDRKQAMPPDRLYCPLPLWIDAGVPAALNTDGGGVCTELSLWAAIYCATHRELFPEFNPEFTISREEAIRRATMGGAYRMMMENKIGSIEVGKLADLAVLTADPLTCGAKELYGMKAVMTLLSGKIVHKAETSEIPHP